MEGLTLAAVKKDHADIYEAIMKEIQESENITKITVELTSTKETLESVQADLTNKEKEIEDKDKKIEALESENTELKTKLDEKEVIEAMAVKKELIVKLVQEAKLPKEVVTEIFMETLMSIEEKTVDDKTVTVEEQVKKHIEDRKSLIAAKTKTIKESGEEFIEIKDKVVKKDLKESENAFMETI